MSKQVLTACVKRMKAAGLSGKLRDDAAQHFLAGAHAADPEGFPDPRVDGSPLRYVDVLEALAEAED